jgi:hypothetical protein
MRLSRRSKGIPAMQPGTYLIYGFEGRGGRYLVQDTLSAREARDHFIARVASGFKTVVFLGDEELTPQELERLADLEERFA